MLAFNIETRTIVFLQEYWRADVDGMEKEGDIYALPEAKGVPNIAFWKGERCPPSHDPNAYTEKREVGMLIEGHGAPQPIPNVSGRRRSAFDFVQILTGVCECNCRCHDG
jgi:hypothetical protein